MDKNPPGQEGSEFLNIPNPPTTSIPPELVQQWLATPENTPISINLSRSDLDFLFSAIDQANYAIVNIQNLLVELTNGRMDEANKRLVDSRHATAHSSNALRALYTSIMVKSILPLKGGKNE